MSRGFIAGHRANFTRCFFGVVVYEVPYNYRGPRFSQAMYPPPPRVTHAHHVRTRIMCAHAHYAHYARGNLTLSA